MRALADRRPCRSFELTAPPRAESVIDLCLGRARFTEGLTDTPDLIIGAGHATHLPMLGARRARGGRAVVLMRPSLPLRCFDACIIPEHDGVPERGNVIRSRGPLNSVVPANRRNSGEGLILVGGSSRHYRWDNDDMLKQIRAVTGDGSRQWLLTDSPRTPAPMSAALARLTGAGRNYRAWQDCPAGWLQHRLGECGVVWVSEDSVSMVYEALTGGAPVGLLEVPARRDSRIVRAVRLLAAEGWATRYRDWSGGELPPSRQRLDEAARCAGLLLQRLYPG